MAFRARLVGGRPSPFCSPEAPGVGDALPRTVPDVADLAGLGRGAVGEVEEELSSGII